MRITNSMMTNQFLSESNEALARVSKYQSQVDSTKRINGISDDPESTLLALKARNKLSNLELYQSNIQTASSYLTEAESAVSGLNDVLQSAYDNVVSAQSGKTTEDLEVLAEELENLQAEIVSIANTSLGTSYIFGGYNYTGSTASGTKSPPFTVDNVSGDLLYNGINLSKFSWADEFTNVTSQMTSLKATVATAAASFTAGSNETYAKEQSTQALDALNSIVSNAEKAMTAAREFGVDAATNADYITFKAFYDDISAVADALSQEISKDLVGDDTGLTTDELANRFSATTALSILDDAVGATGLLTGSPSPMDIAISGPAGTTGLADDVAVTAADQTALGLEADKKTTLQIGTSQTVDITLTGLELLGTGEDNLYHILGKTIQLLRSGAGSDELGQAITALQNAQSSNLTLETKVGATQNRLTQISDRYDSSKINYTTMKSNAEDADLAESIINLTTAQSVYNAALAGGAELIKTSLIDFLN